MIYLDTAREATVLIILKKSAELKKEYLETKELHSAVYILQEVFNSDLWYDFEPRNHNPYSKELYQDVNRLVKQEEIKKTKKGKTRSFTITEEGLLKLEGGINHFVDLDVIEEEVDKLFQFVDKPENLELYGTILLHFLNDIKEPDKLKNYIKTIKPHFDSNTIEETVTKIYLYLLAQDKIP